MSNESLPQDLLQLIKAQQVRDYAIAHGWRRVQNVNGDIALFDHPKAQWDQLIVPMDEGIDDYTRRIHDIVRILSDFESRPASQILNDLLTPDSDILMYRVASHTTARGSIPLIEGIRLLDGVKRSILAAACSVVNPIVHHPRMSRSEPQQLLNGCHLGQTKRGSFAVSISCPLRAVEQNQLLLPGNEPFTRQTVALLMKSLSRVVTSIEKDDVPSVFVDHPNQPVLSINLCEAILQMQPTVEDSQLDVKVSWASSIQPPVLIPKSVRIKHEYFSIIEDISKKLQSTQPPVASLFVGHVDKLGGEPGADGLMQGEAFLSVMHEEQTQPVRVDLNHEYWLKAHAALGVHGLVKFKGIFQRGTRVHRITNISDFDRVQ